MPLPRRPEWLKVKARTGPNYLDLKRIMRDLSLHTVCEEAGCPNIFECWEDREATFLILGERCTRRCGFCDVMTAKPDAVDEGEPARIGQAVLAMGLQYVVLTGVARDDLPDGGARIWASCVRAVREAVPGCGVEVLPADFKGGERDTGQVTKSNLILGMGERPEEVPDALHDLAEAGCDIVTMGQYLQPTRLHLPVDRWVRPEEFAAHKRTGESLGISHVEAGPLVRSSYHAGSQLRRALDAARTA